MIFKSIFEKTKPKHSKAEAGYVGHTVKGQRCDECTMWIKGGNVLQLPVILSPTPGVNGGSAHIVKQRINKRL
jgi:hypothetical protein